MARLFRRLEHLAFNAAGDTVKASSRKSVSLPAGRWAGFARAIILSEATALNVIPYAAWSQSYPLTSVFRRLILINGLKGAKQD